MKKILSGTAFLFLIVSTAQSKVIYRSPPAKNFQANPSQTPFIYNASSVPLKITNNIGKAGGITVSSINRKTKIERQRHDGPITLSSGEVAIPTSYKHNPSLAPSEFYVHSFTPFALYKSKQAPGWSGPPKVTHKGKTRIIDKIGYWIFTDHGVFFADQPTSASTGPKNLKGAVNINIVS